MLPSTGLSFKLALHDFYKNPQLHGETGDFYVTVHPRQTNRALCLFVMSDVKKMT